MEKLKLAGLIASGTLIVGAAGASTVGLVQNSQNSKNYDDQIAQLQEQIVSMADTIDSLNDYNDQLEALINGNKTDINNIKSDINNVKTDVSGNKTDISDIKSNVSNLKDDVDDLKDTADLLDGLITANKNAIDDIKDDITSLKAKDIELATGLSTLTGLVNQHLEDAEEMQGNIENLLGDVEDLASRVEENEKDILDLGGKVLELSKKTAELDDLLGKISFEVSYTKEAQNVEVANAGQFVALQEMASVDETITYKDQKIELTKDIDLKGEQYTQIPKFEGTLDGNGNTLKGIQMSSTNTAGCADYSYNALIKDVTDGEVKNLVIESARFEPYGENEYSEESDPSGYAPYEGEKGIIAGQTHGNAKFENITLKGCYATTYNNSVGGVVAEVRDGTTTFKNITIDSDCVFEAYWGTPDGSVGGLVGLLKSGAKVVIDSCNIACKIDAYNDACANYQYYNYRYAGMLVSYVQSCNPSDITVTNTTVTFDSWNQYRYCKNEDNVKFHRINNVFGEWGDEGAPETHEHSYEVNEDNHNRILPFHNIYGYTTGVKATTAYADNLVQVDDHYEDKTSISGLTIIYLNGSEFGLPNKPVEE